MIPEHQAILHNCSRCSTSFLTKRELLVHEDQVHKQHLRLVCPWCTKKPRDFGYPHDLRRHVKKAHPKEEADMPPKLLHTPNCIYICQQPGDFREVHGPAPCDSEEAKAMRSLMAQWCSTHQRDFKRWEEGWILATSTPTTSTTSTHTSSAPFSVSTTPCTRTTHRTHTTQAKVTESENNRKRTYDRTLSLKSLTIAPSEVKAHLQDDDTYNHLLVNISPDVLQDPKHFSALGRRMTALSEQYTPPTSSWEEVSDAKLWEDISLHLGIPSKFVVSVQTQPGHTFKLVRTTEPTIADTATNTQTQQAAATLPAQGASTPYMPRINMATLSETSDDEESLKSPMSISLAGGDTPSYNPESPSYRPSTIDQLLAVSSTSPSYNPQSPCYTTSSAHSTVNTTQTLSSSLPTYSVVLSSETHTVKAKLATHVTTETATTTHNTPSTSVLPVSLGQLMNDITHTVQSTHTRPTNIPAYIPTPINSTDRLKGMAVNLLKVGSLPLLPPAPREWSTVPDESITLTDTLLWPPKSWLTLSADQRAMASDFAALSVDLQREGNSGFPERSELRHAYNFIMLPGCKGCRLTTLAHTQIANYNLVKALALGSLPMTLAQQELILQSFHICTPTPLQTRLSHVPLRLHPTPTAPPTEPKRNKKKKNV